MVDGELVTTNLVDINLGIRILLGSSYYDDWDNAETFVKHDPLGNPVDKNHPWNQTTIPKPQKRDFGGNYTWVMSPRWLDKRTGDHLALDTGGGPIARLWATALAKLVDIGYVEATGSSVKIRLPKTALKARSRIRMEGAEMEQRDRTRSRPHLFPSLCGRLRALFPRESDGGSACRTDCRRSRHSRCRTKRSAAVSTKPCAACSRITWSFATARSRTTIRIRRRRGMRTRATSTARLGLTKTRCKTRPIFEENGPDNFKGIDIMRAVRSFDPCLPCGVHMYLGGGKLLKQMHTPTALAGPGAN